MKHIGNITEVDGGRIDPVDIITFGSPCQDLSVAGSRKGLAGKRSGLFLEAVRVIREMREKTNGQKPEFIVWENVPGAFSSNGGEDFRTVLEEIAKIKDPGVCIPGPDSGKWTNAGEIVGDGYSIAYRVYGAQFWGVPQRRNRIYLVADFSSGRAGKIQFESDRLCRDTPQGAGAWQKITGTAGGCLEESGRAVCLNDQGGKMGVTAGISATLRSEMHGHPPVVATFSGNQGAKAWGIGYSETTSPTLKSEAGGNTVPQVIIDRHTVAYGISSKASNAWKSNNPHSGCYKADVARMLNTNGGDATCNQGGNLIVCPVAVYENYGQDTRFRPTGDIAQTVVAKYGTGGGNQPLVVQPYTIGNGQVHDLALDDKARTMNCMHDAQAAIVPQTADGYPYIVRRLMPLECSRLQGYPDYWVDGLETEEPSEKEIDWWMEVFELHRIAVKPDTKPKTRNQVRKWLQHPHSDSAEYKMWGNSLAIPNAYHVLKGIAEELQAAQRNGEEEKQVRTDSMTAQQFQRENVQMTIWDFIKE